MSQLVGVLRELAYNHGIATLVIGFDLCIWLGNVSSEADIYCTCIASFFEGLYIS